MLKVVIAGRPNVGKSSLFNKLTRSRDAIVHDLPGVTRDVIQGVGRLGGLEFALMDTAGVEGGSKKGGLDKAISDLARAAFAEADLILFMVDGIAGVHSGDESVARELRKFNKPVLLLANKSDSKKAAANLPEFFKLGFGAPFAVSAEHNMGFDKIGEFIEGKVKVKKEEVRSNNQENDIKISIMGQPNVGKSTLINKVIGAERMLAYDQPGVTRDSVAIPFSVAGRELTLIDTPGLRRKGKVREEIETIAAVKALAGISEVDAVILVLDATDGVEKYDMNIASRVVEKGKVLVVALNKWDKIPENLREDLLLKLKHEFKNSFNQIVKPLMLPISAETGTGVKNIMKRVLESVDKSRGHLPTSLINRVVEKLVKKTPPPLSRIKRPMKIKFAAQTGTAPVEITLYVGEIVDLPESYERFLRNGVARELGWENLVVRINYKKGANPYKDKKS